MSEIKYRKLNNGDWGIGGDGQMPAAGEVVSVTTKSGKTKEEVVREAWQDGQYWRASLVREDSGGGSGGGGASTAAKCPCCGAALLLERA